MKTNSIQQGIKRLNKMKTIQIKITETNLEVLKEVTGRKTGAAAVRKAIETVILADVAAESLKRHGLTYDAKQSDNLMKSRLEDMRSGNGMSLDEFEASPV